MMEKNEPLNREYKSCQTTQDARDKYYNGKILEQKREFDEHRSTVVSIFSLSLNEIQLYALNHMLDSYSYHR